MSDSATTPVRTRFAPSPTGYLHVGGARTALYNWLYARHHGGSFVLRVEDTDAARNTDEACQAIFDGMNWLGMDWDEGPQAGGNFGPYFQSQRSDIYQRYLDQLTAAGHAYEDDGAIRFRVPDRDITITDSVCGTQSANLHQQGSTRWDEEKRQDIEANPDLVIRRPDGSFIFHFVNVVDDIEMQISHVIRGEDHLTNTIKHVALFEAFGAKPPVFAHIPLNLNEDGSKMSKRDTGAAVGEYRAKGFVPSAVNNYLALLGWSPKDDREIISVEEMIAAFDLPGINQSNSRFDYKKCVWVNGEHLRALTPSAFAEAATPFLEKANVPTDDERLPAALDLVRERVQLLTEVPQWIGVIFADEITVDPQAAEKARSKEGSGKALEAMSATFRAVEEWSDETVKAAIHEAADGLGVKMGALMLPCRVAATGSTTGVDLIPALRLIGKEEVITRLDAFRRG
jgi:glutamyl-tRNA synthetase